MSGPDYRPSVAASETEPVAEGPSASESAAEVLAALLDDPKSIERAAIGIFAWSIGSLDELYTWRMWHSPARKGKREAFRARARSALQALLDHVSSDGES